MLTLADRARERWRDATLVDAGWLLGFAVLFYASKWAGKLIDEVPGHSGAFWIPVLLLAAAKVGRPGVATTTAAMGAVLWCVPKGVGPGSLAPYLVGGITVDLLSGLGHRLHSLPVAVGVGITVHLAKFAVHNVPYAVLGVPADFLTVGMLPVMGLHVLFGAIGGAVGWSAIKLLRLQ